jgi:SAM-dependent methyltransferase
VPLLDLPYFDQLIEHFDREPDSDVARAFRRHVHWGCFDDPDTSDDSAERYMQAAEELTRRICDAASVQDAMRVLDVGCGFGGTLDHLDARLRACELHGLNIDGRQVRRARALVAERTRGDNTISFVVGDGSRLPFADGSLDALTAVECVFHFPSRKAFFREAARVLRPGGLVAFSDFVLAEGASAPLAAWLRDRPVPRSEFYGANAAPVTSAGYGRIARASRLAVVRDDDLTARTLPTYPAMRRLYSDAGLADGVAATTELEAMARHGFVEYRLLAFEAQAK